MRAIISFLLCFVVAFQGIASAHVLLQPCPMDQMQQVSVTADADDCCNDSDTVAQTGKLCKTSVPCSSVSSACLLPAPRVEFPAAPASGLAPAVHALNACVDLPCVWRPPLIG
jgi:hypothetical protein